MATIYQYRVKCLTDNKYEYVWSDTVPTVCPVGGDSHTIDPNDIVIVQQISSNDVTVVGNTTQRKDAENNMMVTAQPRVGSGVTYMSHNFGDPKTWWMNATMNLNVTLQPKTPGNYSVFLLPGNLLDTGNGKITFEERRFDILGNIYIRPVLSKNGTVIAWSPTPPGGVGSNPYTIDYAAGEITFTTPLQNTDVLTATYFTINDSTMPIRPLPGMKLRIEKVECQFSKDVDFTSKWLVFQPYVYVTGLGTIPYGDPVIYKNMKDYLNESNNSEFNMVPASGGLTKDVYSFVWSYPASKDLYYQTHMKLAEFRIFVYDPVTGSKSLPVKAANGADLELGTITFYCLSESLP